MTLYNPYLQRPSPTQGGGRWDGGHRQILSGLLHRLGGGAWEAGDLLLLLILLLLLSDGDDPELLVALGYLLLPGRRDQS